MRSSSPWTSLLRQLHNLVHVIIKLIYILFYAQMMALYFAFPYRYAKFHVREI